MSRFYRRFIALAVAGACALVAAPASSAGVRYVTVVNLTTAEATATLLQGRYTVAIGKIEPKRDYVFDIPPGVTDLAVVSSACPNGKRLGLPTVEKTRAVINAGCALSIQ